MDQQSFSIMLPIRITKLNHVSGLCQFRLLTTCISVFRGRSWLDHPVDNDTRTPRIIVTYVADVEVRLPSLASPTNRYIFPVVILSIGYSPDAKRFAVTVERIDKCAITGSVVRPVSPGQCSRRNQAAAFVHRRVLYSADNFRRTLFFGLRVRRFRLNRLRHLLARSCQDAKT